MNRQLMKAGEKNYLKESNGTKANCNANVTQVWKSRIYNNNGPYMTYLQFFLLNAEKYSRLQILQDGGVNLAFDT